MPYIHTLPDFPLLEREFNKEGFKLEVDLSNSLVIERKGEFIEYDSLPKKLKKAIDVFAYDNDIEC